MYKLMVMSAAYRQSAKSTPEQLSKDPKNLLLAHGPRFRMDAETLRDVALQSSGLLVSKIGGPSVKPYQPANIWEQGHNASDTRHYEQEHGDALYRRSMYTYWKRMAMMPDMDAFDATMRDVVCTRRQRTDTPLQALVTMNDVQWVEAARALAERVIREGGKQPRAAHSADERDSACARPAGAHGRGAREFPGADGKALSSRSQSRAGTGERGREEERCIDPGSRAGRMDDGRQRNAESG